jgi:hypothetical protein
MKLSKYNKAFAALGAALLVAIPSYTAASNDGTVSLQEWLTVLGLFLGPIVVALSPANRLSTGDLVEQVIKNPDINLVDVKADVSGIPKRI